MIDEFDEIIDNAYISFSKNCCTGLLEKDERCECWRCRKERNEPVTENSEKLAEQISKKAKERNDSKIRELFRRSK